MANPNNCLTALEYKILFEKGTEAPFSHHYNTLKDKGIFVCKNCEVELFNSQHKYDSGSGWPSFYDQIDNAIAMQTDLSNGIERIEIMCNHCKCHLGHVFPDGPAPSGLRYCVNGHAINFKSEDI